MIKIKKHGIKFWLIIGYLRFFRLLRGSGLSALILLLIFLLVFGAVIFPRDSAISIFTLTEKVTISSQSLILGEWEVSGGKHFSDPLDPGKFTRLPEYDVFLSLGEGSEIEITKHKNSPMRLMIRSLDTFPSKILMPDGSQITLQKFAYLEIDKGWPRTLPVKAYVTIGDDIANGVNHILQEGQIQLIEKQLFGSDRYIAAEASLDRGDRLVLNNVESDGQPVLNGFLRADENEMISGVFHGKSVTAKIERMGAAGYTIKESIWRRIVSDPFVAIVSTLLGILLIALEIVVAMNSLKQNKREARIR